MSKGSAHGPDRIAKKKKKKEKERKEKKIWSLDKTF